MSWAKDLSMGAKFAVTGGREGWARVLLTAVGVGLGVALLLLTAAVPNILASRDDREDARLDLTYSGVDTAKADNTLLVANLDTTYREKDVRGRAMEPEGARAPLPPGVTEFPGQGEMVVSPALDRLLKSDSGSLLRERLPYRTVGTIGESGLIGSHELFFIMGAEGLAPLVDGSRVARIDKFGNTDRPPAEPWDPVLILLILVIFVVLLMPVGVFIAAAVRFGGERRDRRLAALRLVGADSGMTRRIAAGEALAGAVLGLVFGAGFFMLGRQVAGSVELLGVSVFPSYLDPSPVLALLVAVAVPAAAVAVTLLAMRGVVIEPLGVVRTVRPPRRRLWWRLLLPLGGLALLYPMIGQGRDNGDFNQYMVSGGVILLLVGITALLPWVVEAVVARLGSGSVSWQLAVRRLQLSSGTAARMVNGIAVAVAGAIALQMLFAGTSAAYTETTPTGADTADVQMTVQLPHGVPLADADRQLAKTRGVRDTTAFASVELGDRRMEPELYASLTVADCATLRELAKVSSCRDGDVFAAVGAEYDTDTPKMSQPGRTVYLDPSYPDSIKGKEVALTIPQGIKKAGIRPDPFGSERGGILATPGALTEEAAAALRSEIYLRLDKSVPDVEEYVRNTMAEINPLTRDSQWFMSSTDSQRYDSIRTGLFIGATCVLGLIGASLLVSQLEQLRERRRLLSALVAFGTRRRTLSLSVLWQTAVPVGIGLLLAAAVGLTLGTVLLKMTDTPVAVDWMSVLSMTGMGALVVLVVTLLSLPPLIRMMRPEGLRTE
ncbi:ABC transporter permease [Streptomyces sp. NBC_00243]|uniref:ABC transporter permease n=1 Tax=Streptomyces sp. NBC_00243 TaxID=2975688 RepID=UPI002DD8DD1F|nr:FtsX-like permease family protein [Streptomyces sp. NBC_00243]WRZ20049.1 ABC transporter permease [Streptomyces sp. NBC_00243]